MSTEVRNVPFFVANGMSGFSYSSVVVGAVGKSAFLTFLPRGFSTARRAIVFLPLVTTVMFLHRPPNGHSCAISIRHFMHQPGLVSFLFPPAIYRALRCDRCPGNYNLIQPVSALSRRQHGFKSRRGRQI
jgi:hypothetical protein